MKQLIVLLTVFVWSTVAYTQEKVNIKQGSKLQFSVTVGGRTFPMYIHIDSLTTSNLSFTWSFDSNRRGRFIMRGSSLDSAGLGYWNQPISGEELEMPATQNVLFLSRLTFSTLLKKYEAVFDEYTVKLNTAGAGNTFKLKDKMIDALPLVSESGTKIWVLNDPASPLILKIEGNPFGVDVELTEINQ